MGFRRLLRTANFLAAVLVASAALAAEPRVSLELATEPGFSPTDARAWSEMLTAAGFTNVRIRGGAKSDQPALEARGSGASRSFHAVGILTADNQLVLPGGRFRLSDRGRLEGWLAKVQADGEEGVTIRPTKFGLLPRQLVAVHEGLATPVGFSTKGKPPREVARQIADGLTFKFVTDPAGQQTLAAGQEVADELQGLSSGTALAAVLRPLGLVLVPEKHGSELRLRIADGRSAKESWPVGWPPKGNPRETIPDLFKYLNVEITRTSLREAAAAIADRLKTPLLIDHNALAREGVDWNSRVDLPKTRTYYYDTLDRLLSQAKLKFEIRVDEAGTPFLWITTLRQ
jgi:hypothetical protein